MVVPMSLYAEPRIPTGDGSMLMARCASITLFLVATSSIFIKKAWWDEMNQTNRPHGWNFRNMINSTIRDMKLWKPVAWSFASSGSVNLHVYNNQIFAVSNSKGFPFNTCVSLTSHHLYTFLYLMTHRDGFSSGGVTNGLYENNHIENGDDCMTVGNGAKNIHFRNSYCKGGHGLSIGSLGKNGAVADVQNILLVHHPA
jgi:polygalacturonase